MRVKLPVDAVQPYGLSQGELQVIQPGYAGMDGAWSLGHALTWLPNNMTVVADNLALCFALAIKGVCLQPNHQ